MNAAVILLTTLNLLNGRLSIAQTAPLPAALPAASAPLAAAVTKTIKIPAGTVGVPAPVPAPAPYTPVVGGAPQVMAAAAQPIACDPLKECTDGTVTTARGICVPVGPNDHECWDACDQNRSLDSYSGYMGTNDANTRQAIAMMVQQARTVQGLCPGMDWETAKACNENTRCTSVTLYRGMCSGINGVDTCLDMCDTSIPLEKYGSGSGSQAGITNMVQLVRAGRDPQGETICPGTSVWLWLWFPILLCCIIGCCFGAYRGFQEWRKVNKRKIARDNYDANPMYEDPDPMYQQGYDQGPPPDYMPVNQDMEMQRDPQVPMASRDLQMEPPMTAAADEPMPVLAPEPPAPEPPQAAPMAQPLVQPMTQLPPQMSSAFAPTSYASPMGATTMAAPSTFYTSHQQQYSTASYPAGLGGSMYSQGGATYQMQPTVGTMLPATASYRMQR